MNPSFIMPDVPGAAREWFPYSRRGVRCVVYPVFHAGATIEERVTGYTSTPWFSGFAEHPSGGCRFIGPHGTRDDAVAAVQHAAEIMAGAR